MKKISALIFILTLLLSGCAEEKKDVKPNIGTIPSTSSTAVPFDPTPQEPEPDAIPDNKMADALINNDRICVKIGEQWGFIDAEGNVIIAPCLNDPKKFNAGLLPVNDNGLYGYMDPEGEWAIRPQFMYAAPFSEGVATIAMLDENLGSPVYSFINHTGRTLTTFRDGAGRGWPFKNGAAIVGWSNQKLAIVDKTGSMVFETQFDQFNGDETSGRFIFDGLISVCVDDKWGFIDSAGKWIIEAQYEGAEYFRNRLCTVKKDGKWGVIDTTGKFVVEPKYDWYVCFYDDLAAVDMGEKYGYINQEGKVAFDAQFDYALDFHEGVAPVLVNHRWGLIDTEGKWVVEPTYSEMGRFCYGFATVQLDDGSWGYIDTTGKLVIQGYAQTTNFYEDGYAVVMVEEGQWTVIDKDGNRLFDATFDGVGNYYSSFFEDGKHCFCTAGR
ncbi:MAG: WG repeat-containing protein [Ruminococcaceae bacterium]|nr:WG repeat-containing protein [Oscillospiraceae bacterium]